MNKIRFNIDCWQALSPGLLTKSDWQVWAANNHVWPQQLDGTPANHIPPMQRRRMSSLSKLAIQTAIELVNGSQIDFIIFSSRHGELQRTVSLLSDILSGEDASPTAFSQSVHNTAAGLYTIVTKQAVPVTSLGSGDQTLHSALIEAAAYLSENPEHRILVVDFDEPLPAPYCQFETGLYQPYALGLVLSSGDNCQISWSKSETDVVVDMPHAFEVVSNFVSKQSAWTVVGKRTQWQWECE
ncbi:3-oxoacyl-ACP synthase [Photobacterium aquae]|uniref:3-oxoacyl-ACP synthase n=1 Tax=Photobacterium aquae TaxID=1195763 RepID=A0A0J1GWS9_9GAMM|nr:beta-ketoacyl synthase chain length factor [Photobacterium aquae]KLV04066.1 3-oxoacyl-ACP synthase [Photobacterium aquae]